MYTTRNFKSKKQLKEAVAAWERAKLDPNPERADSARGVTYFQPGPFGGNEPRSGTIYCEGPHYPEPHRWYAACECKDGIIIKVK